MTKALARIGAYASLLHITCCPAALNVLGSHASPSSRKFGSPGIAVLKSYSTFCGLALSTTYTWLHPAAPWNRYWSPIASPLL